MLHLDNLQYKQNSQIKASEEAVLFFFFLYVYIVSLSAWANYSPASQSSNEPFQL